MAGIDCSLLADGPADVALLPILEWVVRQHARQSAVHFEWADLRRLPSPPRMLAERITQAVELYPCDVLFVHRDAERQNPELRYDEIRAAVEMAKRQGFPLPHVCVVPVRMQEAWLLLDAQAIRRAADNPNGKIPLDLPPARRIEDLPNPKAVLYDLLSVASGKRGRRLKRFRPEQCAPLVTQHTDDFRALRSLSAFRRLEHDIHAVVEALAEGSGKQ